MSFVSKGQVVFAIFLVLAPLVFFSFAKTFSPITGAVIIGSDVLPEVEQFVMSHPLTRLAAPGAKVCILIDDDAGSVSFSAVKNAKDDFSVNESVDKYCGGSEVEDFILEYVSYAAFKRELYDNSCDSFKSGWKGDSYYFLISKQVLKGGDIVCDDYFAQTYCGAVNFCYTSEEISAYKLDCCVDYSPSEDEAAVIDELSAEGVPKGSTVDMRDVVVEDVVESSEESRSPESSVLDFDLLTWVGLPLLIVVLVVVFVLLKGGVIMGKKPSVPQVNPQMVQLQGYIVSTVRMGYAPNQVYYHLLQQGWPKDVVDSVFQNIYKQR